MYFTISNLNGLYKNPQEPDLDGNRSVGFIGRTINTSKKTTSVFHKIFSLPSLWLAGSLAALSVGIKSVSLADNKLGPVGAVGLCFWLSRAVLKDFNHKDQSKEVRELRELMQQQTKTITLLTQSNKQFAQNNEKLTNAIIDADATYIVEERRELIFSL